MDGIYQTFTVRLLIIQERAHHVQCGALDEYRDVVYRADAVPFDVMPDAPDVGIRYGQQVRAAFAALCAYAVICQVLGFAALILAAISHMGHGSHLRSFAIWSCWRVSRHSCCVLLHRQI